MSIRFNPTTYTVQEGNSVELIIERVGDAEVPVVARVSTSDGSATGKNFKNKVRNFILIALQLMKTTPH